MGDFSTLANRRADALKALVAFGVTQEQVFAKLGVEGAADIGLDHLVTLRGLITALKEGDTTPEQAFAADDGAAKQTKPAEPKKPEALPEMPADKFNLELPKWREAVKAGKLKPAQIIATTLTKYILSDNQKLAIEDLAVNYGE